MLCGFGEAGWYFVKGWLAERRASAGLVVIEADASNPRIAWCRERGVPVIVGDARAAKNLCKAHAASSACLIDLLPDDDLNLELALAARQHVETAGRSKQSALSVLIHVDDTRLSARLEYYYRFGFQRATATRFFSVYEMAAQALFRAHPPDVYADVLDAPCAHLAIYGLGLMGEQVLIEAAGLCHFLDGKGLRVTVFDAERDAVRERVERAYPMFSNIVEVAFESLETGQRAVDTALLRRIPDDVTQHVICFDNDKLGASFALSLRQALLSADGPNAPIRNAPVMVRMSRSEGLAAVLGPAQRAGRTAAIGDGPDPDAPVPDGIHVFGMMDQLLKPESLLSERTDALAKKLHGDYLATQYTDAQRATFTPEDTWEYTSRVEWPDLPSFLKRSNRNQGDHIDFKLRAARLCRSAGASTPDSARVPSQPRLLDRLAEMEHRRWNAERWLAGWKFSAKRVDAARRHNLLRPWDELSENARDKDRAHVRRIGHVLGREEVAGSGESPGKASGETVKAVCWIGVAGLGAKALYGADGKIPPFIEQRLRDALGALKERHPHAAFMVLSTLAEGAPRFLAKALLAEASQTAGGLDAELFALLPLPFEVYHMDFGAVPEAVRETLKERRAGILGPNPCGSWLRWFTRRVTRPRWRFGSARSPKPVGRPIPKTA